MKNLIWFVLVISVFTVGCKKEDESLGLDLLPGVTVIETRHFQDKESITAYTYLDDSIRVERPRYNLLGSFNDPLFGYTNASFGAQFRMPYNPKFESDAVLDSLILQMSYKYVYGDTITPQIIRVRELADDLQYDARYLSTYKIQDHALPEVLGSKNITPRFRTDVFRRDTASQIIRIRLNPELGNRLLKMDSAKLASNDIFLQEFKGLLIEAAPLSRKGALMRIDAPSGALVTYYHTAEHDSLGYAFRISDNSAVVSGYSHDYSGTPFFANLNQQTGSDSLVYLQPTGGTKVRVNIPNLSNWKDSTNFAINKAILTFHVDTIMSDIRRYEIPPQILLKYITDDGKEANPKDLELSQLYYGGFYNPLTATYSFNITQHLQLITSSDPAKKVNNNGFYLVPLERNTSAKRVVLKSGNSSRPIELNVVYTRYKQ